jgi:hypothetical protein
LEDLADGRTVLSLAHNGYVLELPTQGLERIAFVVNLGLRCSHEAFGPLTKAMMSAPAAEVGGDKHIDQREACQRHERELAQDRAPSAGEKWLAPGSDIQERGGSPHPARVKAKRRPLDSIVAIMGSPAHNFSSG